MSYLIDTSVISELNKRNPSEAVTAWFESVDGAKLYLSVLVVGEIRQGIERLRPRDPGRAERVESWLGRLAKEYEDRLIPITSAVAEQWGRLNAERTLSVIDGLIAATGLTHDLTLVTRNVADFDGTSVRLLDPFTHPELPRR